MSSPPPDPMDFFKNLWNSVGVPLPGMAVPTLDCDELEKRIADLKAVEGWLKMNLNMLQMSIQALEMQKATLSAFQAMGQTGAEATNGKNTGTPFSNAALWPWNFMQPTTSAPPAPPTAETPPPDADKSP